jgi:YVTN family beta-propeller protein
LYLHNRTVYEAVKQTSGLQETPQVDVGDLPSAIAVDSTSNSVYVANSDSDTVSVISGENNTKIGEDIPVGEQPTTIATNEDTNATYVVNTASNSVSVIVGVTKKLVPDGDDS